MRGIAMNSSQYAPGMYRRRTFSESPQIMQGDQAGGTLDSADVGQMKIGHFTAHKSCVVRHPFAMSSDTPDYLMIAVQKHGQCDFEQQGRTMRLPAGTWGLCDAPKPCLSRHTAGGEQVHFLIPRDQIRLGIDPRFALGRTFTGASKVAALMCQSITSLFEELPSLGARQAEELSDIVLRLFHIAVHERIAQPAGATPHEDMRERIRNYAESRLRDPRLSLDQIAAGLNCTKRYLHMVFAAEPQTLNQYIWARRLERSRQELENPALRDRTITEIALAWGFSNVSHFSRAFRERYECSPRDVREALASH
jgi:AraC-like DNA-binding protein